MPTKVCKFDEKRAASGVSSVFGPAKPPQWLKRQIIACIKHMCREGGADFDAPDLREHVNHLFYTHVLSALDDFHGVHTFTEMYDHPGRTKIDGKTCFVLEPYPAEERQKWERQLDFAVSVLAEVLDCNVSWSTVSWHYPEHSYRILFSERAE